MPDPLHLVSTKLGSLRQNGKDKWMAMCPVHDDRKESLSVRRADDGKILLHCFAGCPFENIVDAMGVSASDLFASPNGTPQPSAEQSVVALMAKNTSHAPILMVMVDVAPLERRWRKFPADPASRLNQQ